MNTRARSLLIAMLGAAIATLAVAAPAPRAGAASACTTTSGVTVIVDFTHFNGNVERGCAAGSPANALAALKSAGFTTAGTGNYGDAFLCRIDGLPLPKSESCATTPPAKSSWSFYTARATDAAWTYSPTGLLSAHPAPGTIIAFAFGNLAKPGILPSAAIVTEPPTTTTKPARPPTTTAHTQAPVTTRPNNPPVKGQAPTPITAPRGNATATTGDPKAPTTTRPANNDTTTTKVAKPKPLKPNTAAKPGRKGARAPTASRSVSTTTTTTPKIIDKVASAAGAQKKSSGSPFAVVLTIALLAMLGVGALINIRDRRRRTA